MLTQDKLDAALSEILTYMRQKCEEGKDIKETWFVSLLLKDNLRVLIPELKILLSGLGFSCVDADYGLVCIKTGKDSKVLN